MTHKKLTTRTVQATRTPGRYRESGGLMLHVRAGGSKQWVLRTTIRGTVRDISFGSVATVSLAEARDEAAKLRKLARNGGDPRVERRKRHVPTFTEAVDAVPALPGTRVSHIERSGGIGQPSEADIALSNSASVAVTVRSAAMQVTAALST